MTSRDKVLASILAAAFAASAFGSGCGHLRQARDHAEPYAVPSVVASQTLNPEAGRNQKVVAGLDGNAAKCISDGYAKSFQPTEGESTSGFQGLEDLSGE